MEQYLGLPPDGSAHGPSIDHLIGLIHWLMFILFVGWGTFYIFTLIRFRKKRQPTANYTGVKSHFSSYLEVGVLVAEVILLIGFSIPLWSKRVDEFPQMKDASLVRIVAEQFGWNIHYPGPDGKFGKTSISLINQDNPLGLDRSDPDGKDDITTINQLYLPVNKPVIIYLSTKDVIHSFNLPAFRVKQDAIPGMSVPVWFTPIKTTEQIREELRRMYSVTAAVQKTSRVSLPQAKRITLQRGNSYDESMLVQDCADTTGATIVAKGERLNADNVTRLTDAGVIEVSVRANEKFDRYISAEEYKDSSGNIVVAKNEGLLDDAVNKLIAAGIKEMMVRPVSNIDTYLSMKNYSDASGATIISKGEPLSEEIITKLANAGIKEVVIAPATPTEIACAQLCGLGHFRMRGYLTVQTPGEFQKWYDEQEAGLKEQTANTEPSGEQTPAADQHSQPAHQK